jgi:hypothetical protein
MRTPMGMHPAIDDDGKPCQCKSHEAMRPKKCKCRQCGGIYNPDKSRADYTGYCSAKCLHAKAKKLGYKKGKRPGEYEVLERFGQVGSVYVKA